MQIDNRKKGCSRRIEERERRKQHEFCGITATPAEKAYGLAGVLKRQGSNGNVTARLGPNHHRGREGGREREEQTDE